MELESAEVHQQGVGRVRLSARVRFDDPNTPCESYWFDVPERYADDLTETGNPWIVCLAPLALTLGEPLRIPLPIDRLLARNVRELLNVWSAWYPALRPIKLEIETDDSAPEGSRGRTGVFFSGGVDSFYTALRNRKGGAEGLPTDDLILVRGFDFPLEHAEAFERHRCRMSRVAQELGVELVDVATNLRDTQLRKASWADLWHGAALGSVGLALERRYRFLLLASTSTYAELEPYGSHPLTDGLLSTRFTRVLHDGANASRLDKTQYVAGSDLALNNLHVCFREISDVNCGRCRKCTLTMVGLVLSGAGDRLATFPPGGPDPRRLSRIFLSNRSQRLGVRRLRALAVRRGRKDFVRGIDRALRRSTLLGAVFRALSLLGRVRGMSKLAGEIRRSLLRRVVR
jgi:hypothetical protein